MQSLEAYYEIDIQRVIDLYKEGLSLNEIVNIGITTNMRLRNIFAVLNLRLKKKFRLHDVQILERKLSEDKGSYSTELVDSLTTDLSLVQDELHKNSRTIQLLRDGNTLLRKTIRESHRDNVKGVDILSELKQQFSEVEQDTINMYKVPAETDGTTILVLSDLHFGEVVTPDVTNGFNEYNNDICIKRLQEVVQKVCTVSWRTDKLKVYLLGDLLHGGIYGGDLKGEVPIMEGIVSFAKNLSTLLIGLNTVFPEMEVIMLNGNHTRMNDTQKTYKKAYDYEYILFNMLQLQSEIPMSYSLTSYATDDVEGHKLGLFHGDTVRSYNADANTGAYKIQNVIEALYNVKVQSLISGHTHKPKIVANQFGGLNIINGSLSGVGEFGLSSGFDTIYPSQTIARIDSEGQWQEIVQVKV